VSMQVKPYVDVSIIINVFSMIREKINISNIC
jgi:hypothetical protein